MSLRSFKTIHQKKLLKSSENYVLGEKELDFSSWQTLLVEALKEYDGYIFTVDELINSEETKAGINDKLNNDKKETG